MCVHMHACMCVCSGVEPRMLYMLGKCSTIIHLSYSHYPFKPIFLAPPPWTCGTYSVVSYCTCPHSVPPSSSCSGIFLPLVKVKLVDLLLSEALIALSLVVFVSLAVPCVELYYISQIISVVLWVSMSTSSQL